MNSEHQKPTVTLEDLLRLKRAERPPVEFWSRFDRELRAKQLAAIVEPRPWWAPLIRLGARFSHYQLPVGAAAILTLSILTVREYRTTDGASSFAPGLAISAVAPAERSPSVSETAASIQPVSVATEPLVVPAEIVSTIAEMAPDQPQMDAPQSQTSSTSHAVIENVSSGDRVVTQPVRYLAASLASTQETDLGFGETLVRPARAVSARQPVREPLTQVVSPSDARLARLLAPGFSTRPAMAKPKR